MNAFSHCKPPNKQVVATVKLYESACSQMLRIVIIENENSFSHSMWWKAGLWAEQEAGLCIWDLRTLK